MNNNNYYRSHYETMAVYNPKDKPTKTEEARTKLNEALQWLKKQIPRR